MIPRPALIAALILIEVAIAGEGIVAIRGNSPTHPAPVTVTEERRGGALVEGAPVSRFAVAANAALSVDIGNADLTIATGDADRLDVSLSKSTSVRPFQATSPIAARRVGAAIQIELSDRERWSTGDYRRVTIVVPPAMHVTVVSAGNIDASGLRADAAFDSENGDVTIANCALSALHVGAATGRITLLEVAVRRLDVKSDRGRIEGTAMLVRDGSVESGDGRISLAFAPGADTLVTAESAKGSIRVAGLPAPAESLRAVRIGAGRGRLGVRSDDGDIVLVR